MNLKYFKFMPCRAWTFRRFKECKNKIQNKIPEWNYNDLTFNDNNIRIFIESLVNRYAYTQAYLWNNERISINSIETISCEYVKN